MVAIEANPVLACRLRERFKKQIEQGVYILIDKAISPSNDEVTFYLNKRRSVQGTIIPTLAARNRRVETDTEEIKVQSVRIGELLRNHGCPKYLKVDIEGADIICLRELCDTHCRPTYISIESSTGAWRDIKAELEILSLLGYDRFMVVDQKKHPAGWYRTLTGENIYYEFERDASGPFGDYLQGKWLSKTCALLRFVPIFLIEMAYDDTRLLAKVIRRIPMGRRVTDLMSWYDTHATTKTLNQRTQAAAARSGQHRARSRPT